MKNQTTTLYAPQSSVTEVEFTDLAGFNFETALVAVSKKIAMSKKAVESAVSELYRRSYATAFRAPKGARKNLYNFRDRIAEVLGKRYGRQFARGCIALGFQLPRQKELAKFDWFASEEKKEKKPPEFGADALRKILQNRLTKCEKAENDKATGEAKLIALLLKNLDKAVK